MPANGELWTLTQTAQHLGIARRTLFKWRQLGQFVRAVQTPSGPRFRRRDVLRWVETRPAAK